MKCDTEEFEYAVEEIERQAELMIDMAEENINEIADVGGDEFAEERIQDLQNDLKAAKNFPRALGKLIRGYCQLLSEPVWSNLDRHEYATILQNFGLEVEIEERKEED